MKGRMKFELTLASPHPFLPVAPAFVEPNAYFLLKSLVMICQPCFGLSFLEGSGVVLQSQSGLCGSVLL
jgi:hypothetical protein